MKKIAVTAILAGFFLAALNAYNPPVGGEDFSLITSPVNLSGANSVTGGALFNAGANSIIVNPALSAKEQRVNLNVGYTFMFSTEEQIDSKIGMALQSGILIPFKLYIFTGYFDFASASFKEMDLGNSINAKVGLAKEITEKLDVGLSLSGGYAWRDGNDWSLCGNIGAVYHFGKLGFLNDFRLGASALNLGKVYNNVKRVPMDLSAENSAYPTLATFKAGVAGSVLDKENIRIGLGLDFTTPCFQNLIVDFNAQAEIKKMFIISLGEKFNLMETINEHNSFIPSIAFIFKFSFNVKNKQYLESNGWSQSEMAVSAGYKNMYETVHGISVGADLDLGMKDNDPPEITLWNKE